MSEESTSLSEACQLVRTQTGHDFSLYKTPPLLRRMERRIAITQTLHIEDYVRYLRHHPVEVELLFREFLIGVTFFFRDAPFFDSLKEKVIGPLLRKNGVTTVRIWVPGCSTGEEAYSIAILIRETLDACHSEI